MYYTKKLDRRWPSDVNLSHYGQFGRTPHASELNLAKAVAKKTHMEEFLDWVYQPDEGIYLGRNKRSWVSLCVFFGLFYAVLAAFFAICMGAFLLTVDWNYPRVAMEAGITWDNPGLGFRPQPYFLMNLIRFRAGWPSSFKPYVDQLEAFLLMYENERQVGWRMTECQGLSKRPDPERVCRFDLSVLGPNCIHQKQFGYIQGNPCILLKLNKIFGWEPEMWNNETEYDQIPEEVRDRYDPNYVPVSCRPQYPPDIDNIGRIEYWPKQGFKTVFFPFINQENYRVPIVMVQFFGIHQRILVQVECRVYAKNIKYDRNRMLGSVRFELLVD